MSAIDGGASGVPYEPLDEESVDDAPAEPEAPEAAATVAPGDTMWGIAGRYGLSLEALIAANPQIRNPSLIHAGEVLHLPGVEGEEVAAPPPATYTVAPGDSMWAI